MSDLIDRKALERIVRRAAELQAGSQDVGEGLTSKEVLALGKDVGIPEGYLRQAMLEEQTRGADEEAVGTWAWLTGPRAVSAHRVVPGDRASVERALTRWMTEEELLQPKRQYADRTTWEPKAGAFASIQRAISGRRRYSLAIAAQIASQVVQLEPGFCLVRLEADVSQQRRNRISGGVVLATIGWGMTGAVALIAPPLALAQILMMVPGVGLTVGGAAIARTHRNANERVQIGLEQVLDRLERGDAHGSSETALPFVRIAEEVRKVFENPKPKTRG
ncbi:MAG TPA: hypothetical protein VN803_00595 [Gemmatimonadales bacterium]|nr:hypothetical protein [Gemmatimonadales bacterium]